jgi:hypothetical protein
VSYRMEEPEWPRLCECRYDEVHDRMDREDCCLHCDREEAMATEPELPVAIKKPIAAKAIRRMRRLELPILRFAPSALIAYAHR